MGVRPVAYDGPVYQLPAAIMTLKTLATTVLLAAASLTAQATDALQMTVYSAPAHSFNVNSVLITGAKEAMVIDAGFTRADAMRIAANVLDSGRTLTTILVSNADPDYYFGAETLQALFPKARLVATPAVAAEIAANRAGKLAYWGPQMGANAPQQPPVPAALTTTTLQVDGQAVELRGTTGVLANRPYVWIPSLRAIVGNTALYGQSHVWLADTQAPAQRQAWLTQLDAMQALAPAVVVPGHMAPGTPLTAAVITQTRDYITRFEAEAAKAADSAALVAAMQAAYPGLYGEGSLDLSAKVLKGEMKWP